MKANKKTAWIALVVILTVACFGYAIYKSKNGAGAVGKPVKTVEVVKEDLTTSIFTNGKVLSNDKRSIAADLSGKVADVKVKEGDWVEAGQVLAVLDTTDLESNIRNQEIQLAMDQESLKDLKSGGRSKYDIALKNADIVVRDSKTAYEDQKVLMTSGVGTKTELDAAKSNYDKALNDYETIKRNFEGTSNGSAIKVQTLKVKSTEVALEKLKSDLKKAAVKAPIAGSVTTVSVKASDMVSVSAPLFVVEDTKNLIIETNISEYEIYKVKLGQVVKIKAEGVNKTYEGKISKIAPTAVLVTTGQASETVVKTQVTILEKESVLKPNFSVKLTINTANSKAALSIPFDAYFTKKDGTNIAVLVGKDKKAVVVKLDMGLEGDMRVQVNNPIFKAGDKVVVNPTDDFKNGDLLTILEDVKK